MFPAFAVGGWIEDRTGWPVRKFVRTARCYRSIEIQAGPHTITAADPVRGAVDRINGCSGAH